MTNIVKVLFTKYSLYPKLMRIHFFVAIFLFLASSIYAQDSTFQYSASVSLAGSTGQSPFWLYSNQNGIVPVSGSFILGDFAAYKVYNPNNPRIFQWSAGAELIASYGKERNDKAGDYFLNDLYVAGRIGPVEFLAGQKKSIMGLVDTLLSSGSLAMSGNARPVPGFKISIPEFLPLHFTNDLVALKASYFDGRLGQGDVAYGSARSVPNIYLHQKSLYLRFGKNSHRLKVYAGINHQAIWGGEDKISPIQNLNRIDAYGYVILGRNLDARKVGSHFGTTDLGIEWRENDWTYFLYRQNIYDTGSLFKVINLTDGLNGFSIKRNKRQKKTESFLINSFLFEVAGTQKQTNNSPLSDLTIFRTGDYYNSYIYKQGYSYKGSSIGTPLIPGQNTTDQELPRNKTGFTNSNRSWVFHSGLTASWLNTYFLFRGTYSRNFGTFVQPFETVKQQISLQVSAEKKVKFLKNGSFFASFYSDIGSLYPVSTSLLIGYRRSGLIW